MVGDRFEERWARVDAALRLVRAQLGGQSVRDGPFDAVGGARLTPSPGAAAGRARPAADRRLEVHSSGPVVGAGFRP